MGKHTQNPVFLMNNEYFIQASREVHEEYLYKKLSENFLRNAIVYTNQQFKDVNLFLNEDMIVSGYVFPVVIHGDWLASFVILEIREKINENDIKVMDAFKNYFVYTMEG